MNLFKEAFGDKTSSCMFLSVVTLICPSNAVAYCRHSVINTILLLFGLDIICLHIFLKWPNENCTFAV